jgi:NADH-quinone oxidoreductase subunit N
MDYSQFLILKEELSLIAVIVILFVADLFMSPDAHKKDGNPRLNTMLPVVLLTIHTLITIIPGPAADAFGGMYHNAPIQSIVKSWYAYRLPDGTRMAETSGYSNQTR